MRLSGMFLASALTLSAQVDLADPDYAIPKENPYTSAADQQRGQQLFRGQCAGCHGPNGEGGRGAILIKPRLRHATDDESLFRLIRDGVKGTDMPGAFALTTREIWQAAGHVRSLGRLPVEDVPGNSQRGQELFRTKGNCAQCHIVSGEGGSVGPELTEIGARRSVAHLRAAVLEPETTLPEGFLQVRVVDKDGSGVTGLRVNEDTFTIQLRDLNGRPYSFIKKDLRELQKDAGKTPMPAFKAVFSPAEVDDLVAYLASLRGKP